MKKIFNLCLSAVTITILLLSCSDREGLMRDFDDINIEKPDDSSQKDALKIASYNIRLKTSGDEGVLSWDTRKTNVSAIIEKYDLDIIGTQEGFLEQIRDIVALQPEYNYVGVGRDDGSLAGETCAVLYKKDKFTVEETGTFWLSENPAQPSYGWDANLRRICTWIKFKDIATNTLFFVFNAHYDHQGIVARRESSKLILAKIKEISGDHKTIFMGDLNSEPSTEPVSILSNSGVLWDSRSVSVTTASGPIGTFYGYDLNHVPNSRIDYIFVSRNILVDSYRVLDDDLKNKTIASDHLPVIIHVNL